MGNCCGTNSSSSSEHDKHGHGGNGRRDWIFLISALLVCASVAIHFLPFSKPEMLETFGHSVWEFITIMWWGILLGIVFVGLLGKVPKEFVISMIGRPDSTNGIFRATFAGVLLDLCSHGILLVAMKLYERGASLGQVMAFLIASPWNSFSLTVILFTLIGVQWTLLFIVVSMAIALLSGFIFRFLEMRGVLPTNPSRVELPEGFDFMREAKSGLKACRFDREFFASMVKNGFHEAKIIIRWMLVGLLLVAVLRTFVPLESFNSWFAPTLTGLGLTMVFATIVEVCSEGLAPVASDLMNRAGAAGNAFAFLMAGVSTDYTEIMALKETTKSWKIAFFLPLVTLPQIFVLALLMNHFGS